MASAPVSAAAFASSTSQMPLMISGPPHCSLIQATSAQESCGSNCSAVQDESEERSETFLAWPTMLPKVRRFVCSMSRHQKGRVAICQMCFGVNFGGAERPLRRSLWRWPRICRSAVSTSAEHFAALARLIRFEHEVLIAHHVELEPEGLRGDRGDILDRADAHGRQREGNAEFLGGAGRQHFAVGMLHAGHAGRRKGHRHRHLLADHRRFQRAVRHVDQHALAQLDLGRNRSRSPGRSTPSRHRNPHSRKTSSGRGAGQGFSGRRS